MPFIVPKDIRIDPESGVASFTLTFERKRHTVYLDQEDVPTIVNRRWEIGAYGNMLYVESTSQYFHRVILGVEGPDKVRHLDHDGLNNRRANLQRLSAVTIAPVLPKKMGRPPKPREEPTEPVAPKKMGRPPKPREEMIGPVLPKKMGRPPKPREEPTEPVVPKKMGRPPKPREEQPGPEHSNIQFKGVSPSGNSTKNPYKAVIYYQGKQLYLGVFPTAAAAARAYDRTAKTLAKRPPGRTTPPG